MQSVSLVGFRQALQAGEAAGGKPEPLADPELTHLGSRFDPTLGVGARAGTKPGSGCACRPHRARRGRADRRGEGFTGLSPDCVSPGSSTACGRINQEGSLGTSHGDTTQLR